MNDTDSIENFNNYEKHGTDGRTDGLTDKPSHKYANRKNEDFGTKEKIMEK